MSEISDVRKYMLQAVDLHKSTQRLSGDITTPFRIYLPISLYMLVMREFMANEGKYMLSQPSFIPFYGVEFYPERRTR